MDKRGISAVIGSILLILIVVSLFSVIAYFMRKSPEKIMQEGSESFEKIINCDNIKLEIEDVCFNERYKWTDGCGMRIGITIKNNNNFKLENFRIKLSSGESSIIAPDILYIEPYGVYTVYGGIPGSETGIEWVKLYPMVNGESCDSKESKINIRGVKECPIDREHYCS